MLKDVRETKITTCSEDKITVTLAEGDLGKFERMLAGTSRLSVKNGELVEDPVFLDPPTPIDDPIVGPHWPHDKNRVSVQTVISFPQDITEHESPGIIISHLCGYNYTPENYKKTAEILERWGFECLRSRRSSEGRYWEQWVLPGLWAAKNELKEIVDATDDPFYKPKKSGEWNPWKERQRKNRQQRDKKGNITNKQKLRNVLRYLSENVQFGSLDVTVQRMAMVIED